MRDEELAARLDEREKALVRLVDEKVASLMLLFAERKEQVALALTAAEKAREKAEATQTHINLVSNEWRGALTDQRSSLATIERVERAEERISTLEKTGAGGAARSSAFGSAGAFVFQILPLIISAIALAAMLL